jgi:hypothetical protein
MLEVTSMNVPRALVRLVVVLLFAVQVAACGGTAKLAIENGIGPRPTLPPPDKSCRRRARQARRAARGRRCGEYDLAGDLRAP